MRIRDCWGTCDCLIMSETECWIIDLKTGRTLVSPEENDQLLIYAMGALTENPKLTRFNLVIVQATDVDNPVKTWTCDKARVLEQRQRVRTAIHFTNDPANPGWPPPVLGDHCQWCPGKLGCPAQTRAMTQVFEATPIGVQNGSPVVIMNPTVLTPEQKAFIILNKNQIERFMKAVVADALRNPPEGLKVVRGNSRTKWANDEAAINVMQYHGLEPRTMPVTIGEAKKHLTARFDKIGAEEILSAITELPPGKPTLVTITDSRPAVTLGTEVFNDEGESDGE